MRPSAKRVATLQQLAEPALLAILRKHRIKHGKFQTGGGRPRTRYATFKSNGDDFEIVISDNIVMTQGDHLYECYERKELATDEALVSCFVARLDRLLGGGPWDT
jgi:hypothetical protein